MSVYELLVTNHGIDGWDARTTHVAFFTSRDKVIKWLEARGYTYQENDNYSHIEPNRRHCMGRLDYRFVQRNLEIDPE